ncbi:MAG: magnesium/cobalt transporter CorA [Actinomycetota bacterium]
MKESICTRVYRNGVLEEADFDPARVSDYLEDPDTIVWLDLVRPEAEELALLAEEFGLHPLALEDAAGRHQRPKVERYENHLFIVTYALFSEGSHIRAVEVDAFVDDRFLITVREDPRFSIVPVLKRWDLGGGCGKLGVGYLLHGLLDVLVDEYFLVIDGLDDRIENLEERVFHPEQGVPVQREIFELRKELLHLRKVVLPLREVLNTLLHRDLLAFPDEIVPYFQDVYDHVLRVSEAIESMRELLGIVLEIRLSLVSNRLNEIMKRVTSWAAIIGVATMLAGIYGMNFRLVPGDGTAFGFWFALVLMAASSVSLYLYFRRKDWL